MNKIFFTLSIASYRVKALDDVLTNSCYAIFCGGQLEKVLDDLYEISYFKSESDAVNCITKLREMGVSEPVMMSTDTQDGCLVSSDDYKLYVSRANEQELYVYHDSLQGKCYADFENDDDFSIIWE